MRQSLTNLGVWILVNCEKIVSWWGLSCDYKTLQFIVLVFSRKISSITSQKIILDTDLFVNEGNKMNFFLFESNSKLQDSAQNVKMLVNVSKQINIKKLRFQKSTYYVICWIMSFEFKTECTKLDFTHWLQKNW